MKLTNEVKEYLRQNGSKGGKNTWKDKTPEERSAEMKRRRLMGIKKNKQETYDKS